MQETQMLLTGKLPLPIFLVAMLFALIGFVIFKLATLDIPSAKGPSKWSWKYWWKDNKTEMILSGLVMYVFVIFTADIMEYFIPEMAVGVINKGMFTYLMVGLLLSKLLNLIRKFLRKD